MRVAQCAVFVLLLVGWLSAQEGARTVIISKSPHPKLDITKAEFDNTRGLFANRLAPLQRCSFFLANNSDKDVVAVDAKWSLVERDGKTNVSRFTSDSFLDVRARPVIGAHSRILVGPRIWVREDSIEDYVASQVLMAKRAELERLADRVAAANAVYVDVDSVIFADGEVAGPNSDAFDREIASRKLAADDVLGVLQDAKLRGQDPSDALRNFAEHSRDRHDSARALWRKRFARQLQDAARFQGNLYYLQHLPPIPSFYGASATRDKPNNRSEMP